MDLGNFDYFKALRQISNDCVIAVPRYENEIDQYSESESEDELPEIESAQKAETTKDKKKRVSQFVLDEEALLKRNVILERVKKFIPPKVPKITLKRLNGCLRSAFARTQRRPRQGISVSSSHYYKSETSSSSTKILLTLQKPDNITVDGEQQANVDECCQKYIKKQDVSPEKSLVSGENRSVNENIGENDNTSQRQEVTSEELVILNEGSSANVNIVEKNDTPQKQDVISGKSVSSDENSSPKESIPEYDDAPVLPDLDIITTLICKSYVPTNEIITPKVEIIESNDNCTEEPQNIDEVPNIPIDCSRIKTDPVLIENQNSSPGDKLPIEVNAQVESAPVLSGGTFHAGQIPVQWQLATDSKPTNRIGKIRIKRIADLMSSSVSLTKSCKKKTTWHSPCKPIGGGHVDKSSSSKTSEVPFNSSHFQAKVPTIDTQTRQENLQEQPPPCPMAQERDPVASVIEAYHNRQCTQSSVLTHLLTEPKKKNSKSAKVHVSPPVAQNNSAVRLPISQPEALPISAVRATLPSSTQITPARNVLQYPSPYFNETVSRANQVHQTTINPLYTAQATSSRYVPVVSAQPPVSNSMDPYLMPNISSEFGQGTYSQAKSMSVGSSSYNSTQHSVGSLSYNSTQHSVGSSPYNSTQHSVGSSPYNSTQHSVGSSPYNSTQHSVGSSPYNSTQHPVGSSSYNSTQERQMYHQYQGRQPGISTMMQPPQPRQVSTMVQPPQPRQVSTMVKPPQPRQVRNQQQMTVAQPSQPRQTNYHQQEGTFMVPPIPPQRYATYQQQQRTTMAQPTLQPRPSTLERVERTFSGNHVMVPQSQSDWLRLQQKTQDPPMVQSQRQPSRNQQPVQPYPKQWLPQPSQPPPYPQQPFLSTLQTSSQTSEYAARAMNTHLATSSGHSPPAANTPPAALQVQGLINPSSSHYNYGINGCPIHPQSSNIRQNGHANNNSYPNMYNQNTSTLQLSISSTVESWSPYSSQSSNNPAEIDNIQDYANVCLNDFFEHAGVQRTNNFN